MRDSVQVYFTFYVSRMFHVEQFFCLHICLFHAILTAFPCLALLTFSLVPRLCSLFLDLLAQVRVR